MSSPRHWKAASFPPLSVLALSLACAFPAAADVHVHRLFSDHAVLQQNKPVRIWGWADAGEAVTATFSGATKTTTTGDDGKWSLVLGSFPANAAPQTLRISGHNVVEIQDLLVGEVWLCSGQSNMEWPLSRSFQAEVDIQASTSANLRLFTVLKNRSRVPLDNFGKPEQHGWKTASPESVRDFSAVGYYFGRDLQKALGVPVGLIHTSWGGSPAEVWTSESTLKAHHELDRDILAPWPKQYRSYQQNLVNWESERQEAEGRKQPFNRPRPNPGWMPTELFNAMIKPLVPYGISGAIWYQGEGNAGRAFQYRTLFAEMIRNWRQEFGQGDFPFLAVQLAPWDKSRKRSLEEITAKPVESDWAELREAQSLVAATLPKVGVAVITDVGDKDDIHPTKKEPVGARLANLAQRIAYRKPVPAYGPMLHSATPLKGYLSVTFDEVGQGIKTLDGRPPSGFAVAGSDHVWHWAEASIVDRHTLYVRSTEVPHPIAVRHGWSDFPVDNLTDSTGLPASPFRTDNWPMVTSQK